MKKIFTSILLLILFFNAAFARGAQTVAEALGWKSVPVCEKNLCGGYYDEPASITAVPHPPHYKAVAVHVSAAGPVIFRTNGVAVLQKKVSISQPGRLITADKAVIYHNQHTGKITDIALSGHVRVQEAGRLLASDTADFNIAKNILTIQAAKIHIVGEHRLASVSTNFDAWATGKLVQRTPDAAITLNHAQYSTCPPDHPAWIMQASFLRLDPEQQKGVAHNVVIWFKKAPIFYTPYYKFPLNADRRSGLLAPISGYATDHGYYFGFPYYWNMAPNYDLVFTPEWYAKRGVQFNNYFRYLTNDASGSLYLSVLPDDREYAAVKRNTVSAYANTIPSATLVPYIAQLQDTNNTRTYLNFENHVRFNEHWSSNLFARYFSDPDYTQDFQQLGAFSQNANQIPSLAELSYQGDHWQDTLLIQGYQTLHPIGQFNSAAQNQYTRLPEFDFSANYPQFFHHLDFNLSGQWVNFDYESAFTPFTYQVPIGQRVHLAPSISLPLLWSSFYISPQLTADSTSYFTRLGTDTPTTPRSDFNASRLLPIIDIDSGAYINRWMLFGGKSYMQTIEPRIFYLYTPYLNQDSYPNFDTLLLPFSVDNLYTLNEFSGFDRLQNANQLSYGITSHWLRTDNADNVLTASLGVIQYFTPQKVCLTNNDTCTPSNGDFSPITGSLTWGITPRWSIDSQAAWDTVLHQVNNAQIDTQYRLDQKKVAILGYQFTHGNPDTPFDSFGFSTNASLLTAGLLWPLALHWDFFGYTYYDLTHHRPQNQYTGIAYHSCCWALRFIVSDTFSAETNVEGVALPQNQFVTTYYVQLLLTGLGSVGNREAQPMLRETLPGFEDPFSNRGHYGYESNL